MDKIKIFTIAVMVIVFGISACNQIVTVPEKVKTVFTQKFSDAQKIKWDMEEENKWEAEFMMDGKEMSANFDAEGNWLETETGIKADALPDAVMNMLNTDFEGFEMKDEVIKVESSEQNGYEVEVEKEGKSFELFVDESGKLVKKESVSEEEENEGNEKAEKADEDHEYGEVEEDDDANHQTILLGYCRDFDLENLTFSTTGENKYFILKPGYQLVLEGEEDGEKTHLEITVTDETKTIGEIETRVVEERESVNGETVEVSRNYYAYCNETGDVFYFGEDVDIYEDGEVKEHEGAWHAFENGVKPGIIMPGEIKINDKYYQELAPGEAMDRAENISVTETFETPAGNFTNCLKTKESSGLNPEEHEFKLYAPNVGLIQDENLLLVKYGQVAGVAGE